MELLFVHNSAQSEVGNQQIGVVFRCAEEEVLGLEISVHDAVVVEISDCGERGADEVCCIGLVVVPFTADAVEELSTEGEVGYEIDCARMSVLIWKDNASGAYGCSWFQSSPQASVYSCGPWRLS
jgi:hypothetical protein